MSDIFTLMVMGIGPRSEVLTFCSGASSSGCTTTKCPSETFVSTVGFRRPSTLMLHLHFPSGPREQVRGGYLSRQDQRKNEQDDDDGPVHPIVPRPVDELWAQNLVVVQQELQEDDGRGQHDSGQHLHSQDN